MASKRGSNSKAGKGSGKRAKGETKSFGFTCPECGFEAKHAMGLGRHRSSRHGVVSQAAARRKAKGKGKAPSKPASKASAKPASQTKGSSAKSDGLTGGTRPGNFVCPDCGFKAKHAMGLGRHRSARHGVVSQAAKRRGDTVKPKKVVPQESGWLTRRQAAALGGVHYNTVRLWERGGQVRTKTRGRETLVNEQDLRGLLARKQAPVPASAKAPKAAPAPAQPSYEVAELLNRLSALADGLEDLARLVRPRKKRGRPPKQR